MKTEIEVWEYKKRGYMPKLFKFFVGDKTGNLLMMGNKKLRFSYLLSKVSLVRKSPKISYSEPDKKYKVEIDVSQEKRIG